MESFHFAVMANVLIAPDGQGLHQLKLGDSDSIGWYQHPPVGVFFGGFYVLKNLQKAPFGGSRYLDVFSLVLRSSSDFG